MLTSHVLLIQLLHEHLKNQFHRDSAGRRLGKYSTYSVSLLSFQRHTGLIENNVLV